MKIKEYKYGIRNKIILGLNKKFEINSLISNLQKYILSHKNI